MKSEDGANGQVFSTHKFEELGDENATLTVEIEILWQKLENPRLVGKKGNKQLRSINLV